MCNHLGAMKKQISSALARHRADTGKSLDDLATPLGVNKSTVMRWENGEVPIPVGRLSELSAMTGIPREQLRPDIFGEAA